MVTLDEARERKGERYAVQIVIINCRGIWRCIKRGNCNRETRERERVFCCMSNRWCKEEFRLNPQST